jgi:antitoxin ParD1/3/4
MPTRNVNLTEHFDRLVKSRVASGRFGNASEVVREGLRLLEQRDQEERAKLKWLGSAVSEGIEDVEDGRYTALRSGEEVASFMRQLRRQVARDDAGRGKERK